MDTQFGNAVPIRSIKASGDGGWTVSGYVSTFGNVDHGGDVIARGAFDDTLQSGRKVRFLFGHDSRQILGTAKSLRADEKGLFGEFQISKTALGADVHTLLKDDAIDSFSIGYIPQDFEYDDQNVRVLKDIELLEVSLVAIPMNDQATVTAFKHRLYGDDADDPDPEFPNSLVDAVHTPDEYDALTDEQKLAFHYELEERAGALTDEATKAEWDTAYINNLPDSAFAVIQGGGSKDSDGKTTPRSLRKLPHHNAQGGIDLPHLRNALARLPQTDLSAAEKSRASSHLGSHARAEGVGKQADPEDNVCEPVEDKPFPNEHACRLKEPSLFQPNSFRRMTRNHQGRDYSVIMGKLKGEDAMTDQAFRYPKTGWTADQARSHCSSHNGASFAAAASGKFESGPCGHKSMTDLTYEEHAETLLDEVTTFVDRSLTRQSVRAANGRKAGAAFYERLQELRGQIDALLALKGQPIREDVSSGLRLRLAVARRRAVLDGIRPADEDDESCL